MQFINAKSNCLCRTCEENNSMINYWNWLIMAGNGASDNTNNKLLYISIHTNFLYISSIILEM